MCPHPCRQPERLAVGRCLRPKMLAHVGQQLQHLVLADATLRDLSALSGRATGVLTGNTGGIWA